MLNTHLTTHRAAPCETRTFRPKQSTVLRWRDTAGAAPCHPPHYQPSKETPIPSPGLIRWRLWHNQVWFQMHLLKTRGFMKILQRVHKCWTLMFPSITCYRHKAIWYIYPLLNFIYFLKFQCIVH